MNHQYSAPRKKEEEIHLFVCEENANVVSEVYGDAMEKVEKWLNL